MAITPTITKSTTPISSPQQTPNLIYKERNNPCKPCLVNHDKKHTFKTADFAPYSSHSRRARCIKQCEYKETESGKG